MSTPPKMLQVNWARPRLIQLELRLSEHGLAMHELRAAGVSENRIRALYPPNLNDYTARLSRLVLHEAFYTAAIERFGEIAKESSPFYPPLERSTSHSVPTLSTDGFSTSHLLNTCSADLTRLMFRSHGVPHEANLSSAVLAIHLYVIPALLDFYHACAMRGLDPMHGLQTMHVYKPWEFEEWVDFLLQLLEDSPS